MSIVDQQHLAEQICRHFRTWADLPVAPGALVVDAVQPENESMRLQPMEEKKLKTYIDGTRMGVLDLHLFYGSNASGSHANRSAICASLNRLGEWFGTKALPDLGEGFKAIFLEQTQAAELVEQPGHQVTARAVFQLGYEKHSNSIRG